MRRFVWLILILLVGCSRVQVGGPAQLTFRSLPSPELTSRPLLAQTGSGTLVLLSPLDSAGQFQLATSSDAGTTWSAVRSVESGLPSGSISAYEQRLHTTSQGLVFVGSSMSLDGPREGRLGGEERRSLRTSLSRDEGRTWEAGTPIVLEGADEALFLDGSVAGSDRVVAIGHPNQLTFALYHSEDQGRSFEVHPLPIPVPPGFDGAAQAFHLEQGLPPALALDSVGRSHIFFPQFTPVGKPSGALYLIYDHRFQAVGAQFLEPSTGSGGVALATVDFRPGTVYRVRHTDQEIRGEVSRNQGNTWSDPFSLVEGLESAQNLALKARNDTIVVAWTEPDGLHLCSSLDGGSHWSSPALVEPGVQSFQMVITEQGVVILAHGEDSDEAKLLLGEPR